MSRVRVSEIGLRRVVLIALFGAISYVLMLLVHFPVGFLTMDVKDVIITLGGLYFGPLAALVLSILVPLLELFTVSDTGVYGFVMNVLGTAVFSVTASLIYKYKKSFFGAVIGLVSGTVAMVAVMMVFNLLVTPHYMGVTVEAVQALIPKLLLPFNVVKGVFNAALVLLLYKPLSGVLQRAGVLPKSVHPYRFDLRTALVTGTSILLIALCLFVIFGVLGGTFTFGI
ncbi:MAG: ECF transporter S component [Ruminococcaceae bacterium]|nr:ECF transporter S component [Oscillospiraceae bacterium]